MIVLLLDGIYFCILLLLSPLLFVLFFVHRRFRLEVLARWNSSQQSPTPIPGGDGRIWFHAASVGEVLLAIKVMESWKGTGTHHEFVLTTNTKSGMDIARKTPWLTSFYFPLDFSFQLKRFCQKNSVTGLVLIETELWPNLLHVASKQGPVIILNGRLSNRHFQRYRKYRRFFQSMLAKIDFVMAGDRTSAQRFAQLGIPETNITFPGNIKFENSAPPLPEILEETQRNFFLKQSQFIFVAGSVQPEELEFILPAYRTLKEKIPGLRLFIVPRHPDKLSQFKVVIDSFSLNCYYASKSQFDSHWLEKDTIHLIDKIGILRIWYALADAIFIGGSLCRRGGQNMIEAVALQKPVCVGPFTDNFQQEMQILLEGDGIRVVNDEAALTKFVLRCATNRKWADKIARNGVQTVMENAGAMKQIIRLLQRLWP